ncbi:pyridoxal phosphate-dependent transferase [Microdochium bolleyi]|uniref:Pyridoxal phosphate-dependent transferase n=1 Tax=Microdochium bolleyi TaxID=196109 RepID=A0A136IVX7_9PEZI|nr:pyridoxal phosphate-dependent transferase [Microdochium bolleyi]
MGATEVDTQTTLPIRQAPAAKTTSPETAPSTVQYGRALLDQFPFDPAYRNMNHGSFGSIPKAIQSKLRGYQDQAEARPDKFIRFRSLELLDESRAAVAKIVRAPKDNIVFAANATTALNIVLRNLNWNPDGKDEILYFSTIYGACGKTIDYIVDSHPPGTVSSRCITATYPAEDTELLAAFHAAVKTSTETDGKRPRICIFDSVSSLPGVRFPWEAVTAACRDLGILSLVDGAQGIGMIDIDLTAADPDFFLSNCHKWLHTPRGCAILYVAERNQHMMTSSLPTSHGYIPKMGTRPNPLPKSTKTPFITNFDFVGTVDSAPYFCVADAVQYREDVLGGEARIMAYTESLAREGGKKIAEILGTRVLDNASGTMSRCAMTNICLPIKIAQGTAGGDGKHEGSVPAEDVPEVLQWMARELLDTYNTFLPTYLFQGEIWTRASAQVYLELDDFEWAGNVLLKLVDRVQKGEYKA